MKNEKKTKWLNYLLLLLLLLPPLRLRIVSLLMLQNKEKDMQKIIGDSLMNAYISESQSVQFDITISRRNNSHDH